MALAFAPFVTSCSEDEAKMGGTTITLPQAAITVTEGELSAPIAVTVVADNAEAVIESISVKAYVAGAEAGTAIASINDFAVAEGVYSLTITTDDINDAIIDNLSKIEVVTKVIDGEESSNFITIESTAREFLAAAEAFEWVRAGGAAGTGLAQFGLEWESNTATSAIIKSNAATKLYLLNDEAWSSIETVGQLTAAINATNEIVDYRDVSATGNRPSYNDAVLAVNKDGLGEYYIIKINSSSVTTGNVGTTITVIGDYKTKASAGN